MRKFDSGSFVGEKVGERQTISQTFRVIQIFFSDFSAETFTRRGKFRKLSRREHKILKFESLKVYSDEQKVDGQFRNICKLRVN